MQHFLLAVLYSACIAAFFGTLLREESKPGWKLGGSIFAVMVGGVYLLGWVMHFLAP